MAFDTSQLTDYSFADIALAAKHAMIQAAVGGATLSIGGRSIGRISMEDAMALYNFAIAAANDESEDAGGGIALVQYGERV